MILAYIDPGSGAMLLQWIIAGILGTGIFFRRAVVGFVRGIFGRKKRKSDKAYDKEGECQQDDDS